MGMRMPQTCWAVFKRRTINLRNWRIWLVWFHGMYEYVLHKLLMMGMMMSETCWAVLNDDIGVFLNCKLPATNILKKKKRLLFKSLSMKIFLSLKSLSGKTRLAISQIISSPEVYVIKLRELYLWNTHQISWKIFILFSLIAPNNIQRWRRIIKLLIMHSSPAPCYFFPLCPIIFSAPFSQRPSKYILPLIRDAKFHTHIRQKALYFCIMLYNYTFRWQSGRPNILIRIV
jgi:hypothetical protein